MHSTGPRSGLAPSNGNDTSPTSPEQKGGRRQVKDNTQSTEARKESQELLNTNEVAEENPSDASNNIKQTQNQSKPIYRGTWTPMIPEQHLPRKDLQGSPRARQSFAEQPPNQREESNTTVTPAKRAKENPNTTLNHK